MLALSQVLHHTQSVGSRKLQAPLPIFTRLILHAPHRNVGAIYAENVAGYHRLEST